MELKIELNKKEFLFWIAYYIYMVFMILQTSFFQKYIYTYYNAVYTVCIFLLLMQELFRGSFSRKAIKGMLLISTLVLLSMYINERQIMIMLLMVFVGRDIGFKKIAKHTVMITSILVIAIIVSSNIGIIQNYVSSSTGNARNFLGFRYVLYAPAFITNIILVRIYLKKNQISYFELVMWLAISVWLYRVTIARLAFYMSLGMLLMAVIMKKAPNFFEKKRVTRWIMATSFIWLGAIFLCLVVSYRTSSEFLNNLNDLLSNRLMYGQRSLLTYGVKILPQDIDWVGYGLDAYGQHAASLDNMMYVDCLYLKVLQRFGLIFYAAIFGLLFSTCVVANKRKDYYLLMALFFVAIHCAIDDLYLYIHYNTFWFLIGTTLFGEVREIVNKISSNATMYSE